MKTRWNRTELWLCMGYNSIRITFRGVVSFSSGKNVDIALKIRDLFNKAFEYKSWDFFRFPAGRNVNQCHCARNRLNSIREGDFSSVEGRCWKWNWKFRTGLAFYEFFQFKKYKNNLWMSGCFVAKVYFKGYREMEAFRHLESQPRKLKASTKFCGVLRGSRSSN